MTFNQLKIIFFLLVLPLPNTQKKMHDTPAVMCQVELVSKQGSKCVEQLHVCCRPVYSSSQ